MKLLGMMQDRVRNVMIIGGSRVAFYLTRMLLDSGCSVTIVDQDEKVCHSLSESFPEAVVICGDGANEDLLLEEGLESVDAFVTLTGVDEENILLSYQAATKKVGKIITKINREEFFSMALKLGLDCIVTPRKLISNVLTRYARALENSLGSGVETLYKIMDEKAEALEFKVREDFPFTGIPLKDLKLKSNTLIAGILRGRKIIIPSGSDCILPEDHVVVLTVQKGMTDLSHIME